ncbi:MAG TPA: M23 family metallopeptidase [Hyphomonadaceae bacterium]|nr:M23 family metallopeptidase [Hyphomonadaceae bacterium]
MKLTSMRTTAIACIGAVSLAACDAGNVMLWPWVDIAAKDDAKAAETDPNAPPPPPPLVAVDPLDPSKVSDANAGAVPNPHANTGAPDAGTPFEDKPENKAIPVSDTTPPVSAETGKPVPALPPATEGPSGPNAEPSAPTTPAAPPATTPASPAPSPSTPATPAAKASFYYFRPGNLEPGSGLGAGEAVENAITVQDMMFPIKDAPAYPQSQVYRYGGGVKGGDQCDKRNFSAPWRDNFCETRSTGDTTFCKAKAHLGQDIRVGTPEGCASEVKTKAADRSRYEIVAVEDGIISNVGSYSISLRADSGGRIYRYLHLNMKKLKVATGQHVKKGDVVGYVSNDFGGTPTTLHLHFEIRMNTAENGWQYAPPYTSLLAAYQRRENNKGEMVADNFVVASAPK